MTLPQPVRVSPIIRLFRYTLLIAGIFYGASRYKHLQEIEAKRKEEKERKKEERDFQLAEEKRIASERDIANLVAIFTPEPEPKIKPEEKELCTFKDVENIPKDTFPFKDVENDSEDVCIFKDIKNEPVNASIPAVIDDKPQTKPDIYSEKFNLSDVTPKTSTTASKFNDMPIIINDVPMNIEEPKNNDVSSKNNGDDQIIPNLPCGDNDYFVETFKKVPYAAPENKESDFFPK